MPCIAGYALYQKLRNEVLQKLPPPNCIVYLSASAEVCHQRIKIRGRVSVQAHSATDVSVNTYIVFK